MQTTMINDETGRRLLLSSMWQVVAQIRKVTVEIEKRGQMTDILNIKSIGPVQK